MSELTSCNYCNLIRRRKRAKEKGHVIKLRPSNWRMGGYEVYSVPKEFVVNSKTNDELEQYSVGWMMEIPDHCCC